MYKIVPWTEDLDIADFYRKAENKGFKNNSSRKTLVDCFNNEREKQVWILYYNDVPVGSVAAHSLDVMGPDSYRICARTCVLTEYLPSRSLRTIKGIITHQNVAAQIYIPACIEWAPIESNLFITSNLSTVGSQRLVHKIFCPALEKTGVLSFETVKRYRGHNQYFWRMNVDTFYEELSRYNRW